MDSGILQMPHGVQHVFGILARLTLAARNWIEVVSGADPDRSSGAFEWSLVGRWTRERAEELARDAQLALERKQPRAVKVTVEING